MNYTQSLDFLYDQLPFFQRDGNSKNRKWNLDKTLALAAHFDNPHQKLKLIHVGGTNGKGSVSHLLTAALQQAGYRTGLYTSPHYVDFRERIKIDGRLMDEEFLVDFVQKAMPFIESYKPSFFELTFVMALCYFEKNTVDVAVIEVGLGGRLDSTNIITPLLSVITNIGYDHMDILGPTLDKIAMEKAGIIKPGIPVIIGERHPETDTVFETKAIEQQALLTFAENQIQISDFETSISTCSLQYTHGDASPLSLKVQTAGPYQFKNIRTALCALYKLMELKSFPGLNPEVIATAWPQLKTSTRFIGRWQMLASDPLVLGDSAHNTEGFKTILPYFEKYTHCHLVLGFSKEKDLSKLLKLFPRHATYYCCAANLPRAIPSENLQKTFAAYGLQAFSGGSVVNALSMAQRAAKADELIYVGGSIFVLGEAMTYFDNKEKSSISS